MKKSMFLIILALSLSLSNLLSAGTLESDKAKSEPKVKLRLLAAFGYTFLGNDVTDTYGAADARGLDRTALNGGFGFQLLKDINEHLRLGVEVNFSHWLNESTSQATHPLATDNKTNCYHTVNMLAVAELRLSEQFFVQTGFGIATAVTWNNKNGGSTPYFMITPGVEIAIGESVSIPVMLRVSSFELDQGDRANGHGFGFFVPVYLMTGVNIDF
ncbi:MAG: outer membrane beta-barrel protein [Spirochaetota bacterium]|nr:outer membrane beta-barrel protein [Spirochaetota bacterium]